MEIDLKGIASLTMLIAMLYCFAAFFCGKVHRGSIAGIIGSIAMLFMTALDGRGRIEFCFYFFMTIAFLISAICTMNRHE